MKKYLRSILCLLLALCLSVCFIACTDRDDDDDAEEEDSIAGTYILDSAKVDGKTISSDDLADSDFNSEDFYIILNEDGTGFVCLDGDTADITWDDEELTADGESIEYTVKGEKLTIELDGDTLVFKKTNKKITTEADKDAPAPTEPQVTSTTYYIYAASMDGTTMTSADLALGGITKQNTYIILRDDGTATFALTDEVEEMGWNNAGMWPASDPTDVAAITFDGDALTISSDGFVMVFLKEGSSQVPALPETTASVVGDYELYSMAEGSTVYDYDTIKSLLPQMNMSSMDELMSLTLNEDGTGKLTAMGIEGNITWDDKNLINELGETIAYSFDGTYLSFQMDEFTYTFTQK